MIYCLVLVLPCLTGRKNLSHCKYKTHPLQDMIIIIIVIIIIIIIMNLWVHYRTNASPTLLISISYICIFKANPAELHISSLLVLCLSCLLLPSLGCHFVTLAVPLLYIRHMTYPAHVCFFLLIVIKISSILLCSLISDAPLSLHVMPSIIVFFPL